MSVCILYGKPECRVRCGACRVRLHRARKFYDSMTNEEFEAAMEWFRATKTSITHEKLLRYVHETVRRSNEPYRPADDRGTVRVYAGDLDRLKALAAWRGESIGQLVHAMLDTCEPEGGRP